MTGFRRPFWGTQPPSLYPPYESTRRRAPLEPLVALPETPSELTGPTFDELPPAEADLTRGGPMGQKILIAGRVVDENAQPAAHTLVEVWQANAAGRYRHEADRYDAPLDPGFVGAGRALTDASGNFRFVTIRPGPYPFRNHFNAWRPSHVHFSVFGPAIATRLVTQMYFEGDPLLRYDVIYNSVPDPIARERLVARLDWELSEDYKALGYRFDIVLRGRKATPWES